VLFYKAKERLPLGGPPYPKREELYDRIGQTMRDEHKRKENEKKFGVWDDLPDGSRHYFCEVLGHHGWTARYVKEVDAKERTIRFYQEIYDEQGQLVEIHEKYPVDKGHSKVRGG
jgi:hypothetical protein